ncbi:PH4alphaMP, partial [Drosophila busckii]
RVLIALILVQVLKLNSAEYFSSTSGLEQLLGTELVLLDELQKYVNEIKDHAELLQSEIDVIRAEHVSAAEQSHEYLNNPLNAFRLIKRLHSDWETIERSVESEASATNFLEAVTRCRQHLSYPTSDDFVGTTLALTRLQQTYELDVAELASGMLQGVKYGTAMSWQDCFVLGQHLYQLRDYNNTLPWLRQSMELLLQESYSNESFSLDFVETVAGYHQSLGDHEQALQLVNHVLRVQPEQRLHLLATRAELEQLIRDGIKQGLLHDPALHTPNYHQSQEFKQYQQVCREQLQPSAAAQRHLRCRLQRAKSYFNYKLEELQSEPYIVQVHEVVSLADSLKLQQLARPGLQRSEVYSVHGSERISANYRTSQGTTFEYDHHPVMLKLRQHVAHLTGLNMQHAEQLQIANYGIGGHYEPHMDSFDDSYDYSEEDDTTNRIATGIFYLSDVQAGGGTAFPFLPLLVKPERGSLLLWYNLHTSGDPDYRTRHAGCPVLQGSKWIANVWIRLRNQDHVRPCALESDTHLSLPFKDHK